MNLFIMPYSMPHGQLWNIFVCLKFRVLFIKAEIQFESSDIEKFVVIRLWHNNCDNQLW